MFILQPKPTFKAAIAIPIPGAKEATITFEFKHMGKKGLMEFFNSLGEGEKARADEDALGDLIVGWEGVDTKYSPDALGTLVDGYPGAALAILVGYRKALMEGRTKN